MMLTTPKSQLDESVQPLIEKWSEPPKAIEILEVVDQVVRYGLGSDFVVTVLDTYLKGTIKLEETSMEKIIEQATWRNLDVI